MGFDKITERLANRCIMKQDIEQYKIKKHSSGTKYLNQRKREERTQPEETQ